MQAQPHDTPLSLSLTHTHTHTHTPYHNAHIRTSFPMEMTFKVIPFVDTCIQSEGINKAGLPFTPSKEHEEVNGNMKRSDYNLHWTNGQRTHVHAYICMSGEGEGYPEQTLPQTTSRAVSLNRHYTQRQSTTSPF